MNRNTSSCLVYVHEGLTKPITKLIQNNFVPGFSFLLHRHGCRWSFLWVMELTFTKFFFVTKLMWQKSHKTFQVLWKYTYKLPYLVKGEDTATELWHSIVDTVGERSEAMFNPKHSSYHYFSWDSIWLCSAKDYRKGDYSLNMCFANKTLK